MSGSKKRKLQSTDLDVPDLTSASRNPAPESTLANINRGVRGMLSRLTGAGSSSQPTSIDPVINPATPQHRSFLRNLISDLASQGSRVGDDVALIASIADTKLFQGGLVDDRKYQVGRETITEICLLINIRSNKYCSCVHHYQPGRRPWMT